MGKLKRTEIDILLQIDSDCEIERTHKPLPVQCPCCGGVFFETTDKYDSKQLVTPNMIQLRPQYADWGWAEVIPDDSAGFGSLSCPECDSMIAPEGRLTLPYNNNDEDF